MRKLDKAATALALAGTWAYMSGVDQDRWLRVLIGTMAVITGAVVHKIGEKLEEKRDAEKERNEKRKAAVFAVWVKNPIK